MFDDSFFEMMNDEKEEETQERTPSTESVYAHSEPIETVSYGTPAKIYVLSIGGSIVVPEKPDPAFISKLSETIDRLYGNGYRFAIVVGGGRTARNYIAAAKALGANNFELDKIGIRATRLNASVVIQSLEKAHNQVLTKIEDASEIIARGKIPIFGGLMPGFTTDAIAALLAESLDAEYVNLTNVDGVYSADPKDKPNAKFFDEISYEKLLSLMKLAGSKPGQNLIIDVPTCLILKRSNIPGIVLKGTDLSNFEDALVGIEFKGTRISNGE